MKMKFPPALLLTLGAGLLACNNTQGEAPEPAGVLRQGLPKTEGGVPGNETYCVYHSPCEPGEGDCDGDNHCVAGAYCLHNHGEAWGYDHLVDMCVADTCMDGVRNGQETAVDCGPGCVPCPPDQNGDDAFCTTAHPCEARQGDCDYDGHCNPGLFCAEDIGDHFGFRHEVDMCLIEACRDGVQNGSETGVDCGGDDCAPCPTVNGDDAFCTSLRKCGARQGDCDYDGHCVAGTYCAHDVGAQFGFRPSVDVCLVDTCRDGVQNAAETDVDCGPGCLPCTGETLSARTLGGSGDELLGQLANDGQGGLVLAGSFRGTTTIGGRTIQAFGTTNRRDVFVSRQRADGQALWTRRFGGPLSDGDNDVAVSVNRGLIAVAGNFHGTADFGDGRPGFALTSNGRSDIFVVLMDMDGRVRWARSFGGAGWDAAYGVEIDDGGNVNVVGGFESSVQFGATGLTSRGGMDAFVLRIYAPNGSVQRILQLGGPDRDVAFDIDSGRDRSLTIVGAFAGTADLGQGEVSSAGARDGFITRMSPYTFRQAWVRTVGGVREDILRAVAVDRDNRSYAAGYFMRSVDFGGGVRTSTAVDGVVLALDPAGAYRWDAELPEAAPQAVSLDRSGQRVAVTGFVRGNRQPLTGAVAGAEDVFTLLYNTQGSLQAGWRDGGAGNDRGSGVVANNGVCTVSGHYLGNASFAGAALNSAGQRDLFLSRRRY